MEVNANNSLYALWNIVYDAWLNVAQQRQTCANCLGWCDCPAYRHTRHTERYGHVVGLSSKLE